jgi:copper transport protein
MRSVRTLLLGGAVVGVVVVGLAPAASAHASLVRSDPPDNAVLASPPGQVRLRFDEAVSRVYTSARVLDVRGRTVPLPASPPMPTERLMVLPLPSLSDGVYTVTWTALSQDDGHVTHGSIVFRIGTGAIPTRHQTDAAALSNLAPPEAVLRWINLSLLAGLIGALAVSLIVLRAGSRRAADPGGHSPPWTSAGPWSGREMNSTKILRSARRRVLQLALWCCWLSLAAGMGLLIWQAAALRSSLPEGTTLSRALWTVAASTSFGRLWLIRQSLLLALVWPLLALYRAEGAPYRAPDSSYRFDAALSVAVVVALCVAHAMGSHAAALPRDSGMAVAADAGHLLAAGGWVGGLIALSVGLLPLIRRDRADFTALVRACWGPFSLMAAVSVGVLAGTGLYSAGRHVASVDASLTTLYGRTLLTKVGLVIVVGVFGLLNSVMIHPRLSAPLARLLHRPRGWTAIRASRLPVLVVIEGGFGVMVLLASGVLTSAPPARVPQYAPAPQPTPLTLTRNVDDMLVTFSAKPNRPGPNVFTVTAASARRPALAPIKAILLHLTWQGEAGERVLVPMRKGEREEWRVGGNYFTRSGEWQVDVLVERGGTADRVARFGWAVSPLTPGRRVIVSDRPLEPILTRVALGVLLMLLVLGVASVIRSRRRRLSLGWDPGMTLHAGTGEAKATSEHVR